MSYCPIEDAFKDPFINSRNNRKKHKQNSNQQNNNQLIENFDCLDGSNQLQISDDYNLKGSLSRHNQGNMMNLNVQLDGTNQVNRSDEKTYYPDMSLESEYALLTDVKHHEGKAYRPPNPFTKPSNRQPNNLVANDSMYESFNQVDNVMALEHDTIRNQLSSPQNIAKNEMIYSGNFPINNDMIDNSNLSYNLSYNNSSNNSSNNNPTNRTNSKQTNDNDKFDLLLQSYKELQDKIEEILQKVNKMESEPHNNENIHDIILFAIFGIFFIYILDSIYRIGKKHI